MDTKLAPRARERYDLLGTERQHRLERLPTTWKPVDYLTCENHRYDRLKGLIRTNIDNNVITLRNIRTFPHCEHLSFCVLLCIQWCLTVLCSLYCRTPSSLKLDLHLAASGRLARHSECTIMRQPEHFRRTPCFWGKKKTKIVTLWTRYI